MSKVVLLKDLYLEIDRMKQGLTVTPAFLNCFVKYIPHSLVLLSIKTKADVRAAREKNGVYIPHERFALDEAEKKVCFRRSVP